MTHFVVIVPYCPGDAQNILTAHFKARGFGWAHWCNECWLLTSDIENMDASQVRGIIAEVLGPAWSLIVLRVDLPYTGANWAVTTHSPHFENWVSWLQQSWQN